MNQEDIQKALEALGKSGINVAGDLVLEKKVEYEVNNVEDGGIGIQIINGGKKDDQEDVLSENDASGGSETDGKPKEEVRKEPPAICLEAVKKVVTPQFTLNGSVFNSQAQLRKAVGEIDLGKNVEIGILMVICKEVGLVKSGISDTDFVRALIGMRFIEYEDDKQITRIAHGFSKKTNNLPPKHTQWSGTDRTLGDRLYEVLRQG